MVFSPVDLVSYAKNEGMKIWKRITNLACCNS